MMTENIKVYSFRRCPFAMRVRMVLHEKGLTFEIGEEDLRNFSPALRALHPQVKVPVLVHGENVIYDSAIITEYLEDRFPTNAPLMPGSPYGRAQARLWTHWCSEIFKPDLDRFKYGTSRFPPPECAGAEVRVARHLEKLEIRLRGDTWLVDDRFTLADIHVFPFVRQLTRIQPEPKILEDYPRVVDWQARMSERPSFKKTMEA